MDIEQLAGTKLRNYEIESLLGRGGMAFVYKASQINLDRLVALKILSPHLSSDASFVKRFKREARAVAKLTHPNIVHIYDVAEEQNLHFFSMEYVEGKTLDKVLEEKGALEPGEAVRIILQAALALEHAHKNNIIHRDVKPSNMLLDSYGNAKVMDFGLARAPDDRSEVTQAGMLIGTPGYMSPEQCRGEELDFRTDIYSLGVVLYEMLTGMPLFDAPSAPALMYKIVHEEVKPISSIRSETPAALWDAIQKMLQKNPEDRYQDMGALISDLQSVKSGKTVSSEKQLPSIVVLPFVNMSADPEQEYFCDGLSEELINALTQIKNLHVIARTSAFSFKGEKIDVRDIGKKLAVGTVLEGSVRKAGNRLRITAQLIDTAHGHHLWSERYDRELDDVFAIQDEITSAIVDRLGPKLFIREKPSLIKHRPVDLDAYNLYLKGRWFWDKLTEKGLMKAVELFKLAIEKDPGYAPALAGLADSYCTLPLGGSFPPKQAYPRAKKAALKAIEIDDTLAEAHASLAHIMFRYDWDWQAA